MGLFKRGYKTVTVAAAKGLIADGATLVDVRSDKEWRSGHAAGAIHIPLDQLASRLNQLPTETPIVTVCHSGVRSAMAARTLAANGYTVSSIRGGMIAWDHARP